MRRGYLGEKDWGRLSQAIGTLSDAKIFIDDSPSIGVLEMRAKCRRLAAEHDAATHDVQEWMTKDPVTLDADVSAQETLALMLAKGFRHVPVTEAGQLVGIVSMRDLTIR